METRDIFQVDLAATLHRNCEDIMRFSSSLVKVKMSRAITFALQHLIRAKFLGVGDV